MKFFFIRKNLKSTVQKCHLQLKYKNLASRKKSKGVISGDLGAQEIDPPLPIQRLSNFSFNQERIDFAKCAGAPSCWKIIFFVIFLLCKYG